MLSPRLSSEVKTFETGQKRFAVGSSFQGVTPLISHTGALSHLVLFRGLRLVSSSRLSLVLSLHITLHLPPAGGSLGFCAFSICAMSSSKALATFSL